MFEEKNILLKIVNIILIFLLFSDVLSNEEILIKFFIVNCVLVYFYFLLKI